MSCSGDCNQGRRCDCCEEVQLEPLSTLEVIAFYGAVIASIAFSIFSVCAFVGYAYTKIFS